MALRIPSPSNAIETLKKAREYRVEITKPSAATLISVLFGYIAVRNGVKDLKSFTRVVRVIKGGKS
jgi:hypothetical protein